VLPPVSKLTPEQAMYHFISGYTAKVAGTEMGVKDPETTFSACFGAAFMVWHPTKYAELLADKIAKNGSQAWLVNTGWSGGGPGTGKRMSLKYTRAILDAIHDGSLAKAPTVVDPIFGLHVPQSCANVPAEILTPKNTWADKAGYDGLAARFIANFALFADGCPREVIEAGPRRA
jgi:phosphoenolpyruvate carboxykinase (ATP)